MVSPLPANQRTTVDMDLDMCNNPRNLFHHIRSLVHDQWTIKLLKKINRNQMERMDQRNNNNSNRHRSNRQPQLNNSKHQPKDNGRKEVSKRFHKWNPTNVVSYGNFLASYAGIAKLNSSAGPAANVSSTGLTSTSAPRITPTPTAAPTSSAQTSNAVRPPVKPSTGPTGRPSNTPQSGQQHFAQPRGGGGGYYGQNNRGKH